jgi:hypothetical protein
MLQRWRRTLKYLLTITLLFGLCAALPAQDYILIGWNDLGMHCANKEFANFVILPPYNNVSAELIKKGDGTHLPQLVTSGYSVTYEMPGNTYSVGKTNFWSYEDKLFGVNLADNIGLTGNGLTGAMAAVDRYFEVTGIPLTPYSDANLVTESPYQLALLKAYDGANNLLATTQCVVPVSNEISCISSDCHSSESSLLSKHENEGGYNPNVRPILCANCHASAALGKPGKAGLPSLSEAVHGKHGGKTNDCYKCHPGTSTKCLRDVMYSKGMTCQSCHGSVSNVASTIKSGRRPWLDEPKCGAAACHGPLYAEEPGKLYRQSRGHGGLFCSTCHGSPHAIVPTIEPNDNVQNIALQGHAGTLNDCSVCHGIMPAAAGPHGVMTSLEIGSSPELPTTLQLFANYPNPFNSGTQIAFDLPHESTVTVRIFDLQGRLLRTLLAQKMSPGFHRVLWDGRDEDGDALPSGIFCCYVHAGGQQLSQKMSLIR